MRKIWFAMLLVPALAAAQPKSAEEWYKEGENQYNLGNFDKAVDAFKQGFALETNESKKAAYLYNVAQSYRQANDCKNALFFYRRFLVLKDADTAKPLAPKTRKEVEDRIAELDVCVQQATSISKKPPNNNLKPDGDAADKPEPAHKDPEPVRHDTPDAGHKPAGRKDVAAQTPSEGDEPEDTGAGTRPTGRPRLVSARLVGGASKVSAGDITVPVQASFGLIGGYPIPAGPKLTIEVGGAFTLTPVPYQKPPVSGMAPATETAQLLGVMANAAATYEVAPKVGLRGDLGLGMLVFSNVSESQFTDGAPATGALTMFHLRLAASAEYAVTPNVVITAQPFAFTYSPPKDGLAKSIKSLTSIDFMVGLGYRM
jgi:hypothetical protein